MQDSSANSLEVPTAVPAPASVPAPSPLTSTPSIEGAAAAAAAGATSQDQQPAHAAPTAAPSPAVMPTAPSGLPPPTVQTAATTPTGASLQAQPCAQDGASCTPVTPHDPICGYLLQDPAFLAAVKQQDASLAAQAAAKTIKGGPRSTTSTRILNKLLNKLSSVPTEVLPSYFPRVHFKLNLHAIISRIKPQQSAALASFMAAGAGGGGGGGGGGGTPLPALSSGSYVDAAGGGGGGPGGGGGLGSLPSVPGAGYSGGPMVGGPVPPGSAAAAAAGPGSGLCVGMGERRISDPDGRFKRGGSCEPLDLTGCGSGRVRELRRGDCRNVKLQQRYLQLIPPQHPLMLGPPVVHPSPHPSPSLGPGPAAAAGPPPLPPSAAQAAGAAAPPPPPLGLPPPGGRRGTSETGGMGPPGMPYMDEQGRPYKRLQLDPSIRPALQLEALPPARVSSTPGRGSTPRVKELVRAIRRDLLALEEAVPWNCVNPSWKNARPGWRRSLQRNVDLHDALMTEKSQGLFARRGAWETRLRELADGGNNYASLQVLWSEMAEGIKVWLAAGGGVPPLTPGGGGAGAAPGTLPYTRSYDGGMAVERGGDGYGAQPLSEDDYYMAAATAQHQHHHYQQQQQQQQQHMPSPFFDYASAVAAPTGGGGGGGGGRSTTAGAAATAVAAGRPPVTPWVMRSELTVLMQSLEAEVDTDLDEGPEATDVEDEEYGGGGGGGGGDDSDAERPSAACRRWQRQRRRQQRTQSLPLDRESEEQQQPAPPADAEGIRATTTTAAAAVAAASGEEPQQQQQQGGRQDSEVGLAGPAEGEESQKRMDVPADTATSLLAGNSPVAAEAVGDPPAEATAAAAAAAAGAVVTPMDLDSGTAATATTS
ncbi:hypothetical protein VOLCADRAFT_106298 [Volvox carteri f. nagariensis]|uniref:Uncharacterized protein n=1 Tax=Volvox carteri f. nagariensis TaxID=3068 RepID=D8U6F4_VOLCA|nr:uncharacterized protein VOLCADRAFT_106298 [Volvox carteri f. nagariensis]EFJ44705.1 hypothetical protein VOLCADRAFT_106298 [Volvox carteri f. nagariensis]|eukprot:XP_002954281.1 hypothetical protein VOLCADRAFT_106298 [Volvox carteri f. nagariensis]